MKKIILFVVIAAFLVLFAGVAVAQPATIQPAKNQKFTLPENAVEVSPGVFYLGESMDKGKVVEGYAFVHYAKDSDHTKPVWDDTVDIYKFMFGGIKWADTMQYEVNINESGLGETEVLDALGASLETWDAAITETSSFELFDDVLGTTEKGFVSGEEFIEGEFVRINRVTWDDLSEIFGANVIAANYFWFNPATKEMIESDVRFNTEFDWSVDDICSDDKMDLQSIATHEFGHNGLNDLYSSPSVELTMHGWSYGYCETQTRTLGTGDISGIQALYGE